MSTAKKLLNYRTAGKHTARIRITLRKKNHRTLNLKVQSVRKSMPKAKRTEQDTREREKGKYFGDGEVELVRPLKTAMARPRPLVHTARNSGRYHLQS